MLLGQPGSGKSTFARHLALPLAEALQQSRKVPWKERLPDWQGKARLPVFVPLRLLAANLPDPISQGTARQVENFICQLVDGREKLTGFGEPLLATKPDGRPRTTYLRRVIKAIFYILRSGCQWRLLLTEFPPYQTVYKCFLTWWLTGLWKRLQDTLRGEVQEAASRHREPSAEIIDSQTVKTTERGRAH